MNRMNKTHPHAVTELCEAGSRLYADALRAGRIARADVEPAPCLMELALLHPDPDDPSWLRPLSPAVALAHRLNPWNGRSPSVGGCRSNWPTPSSRSWPSAPRRR